MRIALVSDIHANLEALRTVLDDIALQKVDRIVCAGDIVGYNTNPAECVALLRRFDPVCVAGNHDLAAAGTIGTEEFSRRGAKAILWTRERLDAETVDFLKGLPRRICIRNRLLVVHDALHGREPERFIWLDSDERRLETARALASHPCGARICAFGHTHHLGLYECRGGECLELTAKEVLLRDDAYYLINPGSVGEPRDREQDKAATYAVLDLDRNLFTARRVTYDAAIAFRKTRKAGLGPRFPFIPAPARAAIRRGMKALGIS